MHFFNSAQVHVSSSVVSDITRELIRYAESMKTFSFLLMFIWLYWVLCNMPDL